MERSLAAAPQEAVAAPLSHKPSLTGLTRAGLAEALRAIDMPEREIRMRVAQLWHWIYFQGAASFDAMLNVSKVMRAKLARALHPGAGPQVVNEQISSDGTRKWLIRLPPRGRARQGRGSGMRLYSRKRPRHALRFEPGRLHP